jgi:microsomal dipeptidase-like Zn-dependent dipeptidase
VTIESTVHRKMTPALTADLANVIEAKAARVTKEKEAAKAAKAKRDKERREAAKAKKNQEASAEFGDLAAALKTLKKHGLRIVTVEEKAK